MHHIRDPSRKLSSPSRMSDQEHRPTIAVPKITLRSFAAPHIRRLRPKSESLYLVADIDCVPYSAITVNESLEGRQQEVGELHDLVVSLVCPDDLHAPTPIGPIRCSTLRCHDIWSIVWCFEPREVSVFKTTMPKQLLRPATIHGPLSRQTLNSDPEHLSANQDYISDDVGSEQLNLHVDFRHDCFPASVSLGLDHAFRLTDIARVDKRVHAHTSLMTRQYSHRPDHMNAQKTSDLCYLAHSVIRMLQGGCETVDVPMFLTPSPNVATEEALRVISDFLSVSSRFLAAGLLREFELLRDRYRTIAAADISVHTSASVNKRPKAGAISKFLLGNRGRASHLGASSVQKQAENRRIAPSRPAVQIDRHDLRVEQLLTDITNLNLGSSAEQRSFKHKPRVSGDARNLPAEEEEDMPAPLFSPRKRPCIRKSVHVCSTSKGSPRKSHPAATQYDMEMDLQERQMSGCSNESLMARWDGLAAAPDSAIQLCTPPRNVSESSGYAVSDDDEERLAEARVMGSPWM